MTRDDYLKAVGSFKPDEHMKSRIAAKLDAGVPRLHRPLRRALVSALAAVLVLASLTGIAMAASPQLREAVLRFFHITETERVPDDATVIGSQPVPGTDIGGRVTAWYIDVDFDGVYFPEPVRLNPDGSVAAFVDWVIDNGTLAAYEYAPEKVSFSAAWRGVEYAGELYYCVHDGAVTTYDSREVPWFAAAIPGRTDAVLLYCTLDAPGGDHRYPFLLDLETGEVQDFLAGTGIGEIDATSYKFSDDMSRVLVYSTADWDAETETGTQRTYYCEIGKSEAVDVAKLSGTDAQSAAFAEDGTLVLTEREAGRVTVWDCDPESGETRLIFDRVPEYDLSESRESSGLLCAGGQYTVYVDADGAVSAVDLATGERRDIEGFSIGTGGWFMPNRSNTKLLYHADGWTTLGVVDVVNGEFVSFERESAQSVSESLLSWYDDEYIMIGGTADDGGAVFYLYEVKTGEGAPTTREPDFPDH